MDRTTTHVEGLCLETAGASHGGGRPPLLLVHGAGHGAWCWHHWMSVLPRRGWTCHALSLRGHPGSRRIDERTFLAELTVADYVADLRAVSEYLGRPAIVVGHSMGGIIVQRHVADRFAEGSQEAGMVLLASVPPGQMGPLRSEPLPTSRAFFPDQDTARRRYFRSQDASIWRPALQRLVPESPSVINEYSLGRGVPIEAGSISCPVLVISVTQDGTTVPRDRRIADFYGSVADYWLEDGIGHDLMLDEGWQAVLDRVEEWLRARIRAADIP